MAFQHKLSAKLEDEELAIPTARAAMNFKTLGKAQQCIF